MKNKKIPFSEKRSVSRLSPKTIAFIYAFVGGLWILVSDRVVNMISDDPDAITQLQTYKGWFYVLMTTLMLYGLIRLYGSRLMQAVATLRNSEERNRLLVESVTDYEIFTLDPDGLITTWNLGAERNKGYKPEEVIGRSHALFFTADDIERGLPETELHEAAKNGRCETEGWRVRKDGSRFWAEAVTTATRDEQGSLRGFSKVIRDIGERKRAENALHSLNRELRAISNCSLAMLRAMDEQTLLHDICQIVCDEAGYRMAWVGYAENDDAKTVRPVAWSGVEDGYLINTSITWADTERGSGPSGTAIRTGESAYIQDFSTDPLAAPWRENALQRGYRSSIALPLKDQSEKVFGVINIYSTEPNAFTLDEIRLLEELAGNLAFGISTLRIRAERKKAEESLKKSEEIFKLFIKHTPAAVAMFDTSMRYILVSPRWLNDYGLVGQDIIGRSHYEIFPEIPDRWKEIHQRCLAGAIEKCEEDPFPRLDGRTDWVRWEVRPWYQSNGEIGGIVMFTEVITERKAAEEKILKERDFSKAALDSLPGIVYVFDSEGRFLRWNRNFEQMSEYSSEEIGRMNPLDFFIEPDKTLIRQKISEAFEKGAADAEADFITKSGKHKPYYYTGRIIQVEGKPCLIGMGIDIADRKRTDDALRKSEEHFRRLTEQSPVPIAISNERGEIEYVNEQFVRTFGYARDDIPNIDAWFVRAYPDPEYRREVIAIWERAVETAIRRQSVIAPHEYQVTCKDGTIRTVEIFGSTIGRREQVIFNDVTERKRAEETVKESRERFKNLVEASSDWVWEVDEHGVYTYASSKVRDILGYEPEEVLGKTPFDFMPPEESERVAAIFKEIAASQKAFSLLENINLRKNGDRVILETSGVPFFDSTGSLKGYRGIDRDITDRKRAEDTIRYQACHDLMTGLPNRVLFADLLDHEILEMQRLGKRLAVLFLDVDQFKNINDSFGHSAGDRLIQHLGAELKNSFREFDTVARIGGDEFTLLLPLINRPEDASRIADKVMQAFKKPFIIDHHEIRLTASIGISLYPEDGQDAASLLKSADIALHFAKDQGRDNYQFYNSSISHRTLERVIFESRLRQAVERGEMVVHYQPQRNIKTGKITGAEALVRWNHPDLGMLKPARFIPLAEETGLIIEIDQWVLRTVCKQLKAWEAAGHALPFATANLSARQFQQPALAGMIGEILEKTGLRPGNLGIEITETLAMRDTELTTRNLNLLNAMGVKLLIDDFGTGYSSLSYLKKLPIHKLKIDRSFITDLARDRDDQAITNAVVAMAHILKLKVVAEGVETKGQESFLESQNCDEMQGFLFSKPVPALEFEKLLVASAGNGGLAA